MTLHFILEGQHLAPFAEFAHLEPGHHEFLRRGYEEGVFLFSGPQVPPHGGFLAARARSVEALNGMLAEEPFVKAGKMRFTHITQFDPVQHQAFLKSWLAGERLETIAASPVPGPPAAMAHFLLEGEHLVPFGERAPELIAAHRAFLQKGYERGDFLFSGPTIPPKGGVLVARAVSRAELQAMLAKEPYVAADVMRFSRITEFEAAQRQPILESWFAGAPKQ